MWEREYCEGKKEGVGMGGREGRAGGLVWAAQSFGMISLVEFG